jgi:hypothetical protein
MEPAYMCFIHKLKKAVADITIGKDELKRTGGGGGGLQPLNKDSSMTSTQQKEPNILKVHSSRQ